MSIRASSSLRIRLARHACPRPLRPTPRRTFLSLSDLKLPFDTASSSPQTITTRRVLPYPPSQIYALVADVDSYAAFLPYCHASRVTAWTLPTAPADGTAVSGSSVEQRRWPTRADLTVGWGPWTESYTSRLTCDPERGVVEAVSGQEPGSPSARDEVSTAKTTTRKTTTEASGTGGSSVFESLMTRWTVTPASATAVAASGPGPAPTATSSPGQSRDWSEVMLVVRFQFVNAAYGLAVGHMGQELSEKMIEAFERRAKELYG